MVNFDAMDSVDFEQQHNNNIEEETVTDQNTAAEITNADEQDQAELVDTGHGISLPIARIKRIIKQDDDVVQCSSAATVAIAAATELFVQYFAEQAMIMARGEKRKKLNYSDFATAVVKIDQLEFLSDLVPRTTTLRKLVREKKVMINDLDNKQMQLFSKNGELTAAKRATNDTDGEDTAPEDDGDFSEVGSAESASENDNSDSDFEGNINNGSKSLEGHLNGLADNQQVSLQETVPDAIDEVYESL